MNGKSKYDPKKHHRRSIRLKGYDYSKAGLYFITICCEGRRHRFGKVENGQMVLNNAGQMVVSEWLKLPERFKNIELHEYVVMPNHFHSILEIVGGATLVVAQTNDITQNIDSEINNISGQEEIISGQPQGIAPTDGQPQEIIEELKGQPQGIAPTDGQPQGINGQPQGIAPTDDKPEEIIEELKGQPQGIAPTDGQPKGIDKTKKTVGDMVGAFQSIITVEYIKGVKTLGWPSFKGRLLQRNYWEHIIRDEQAYQNISNYIVNNPSKWDEDKFNSK